MSPPGLRCETIIMLEHRSAFAHSLRGSSFTFLNYIHKCFDLRSAVSWATPIAVTDPTIVFDSHPSCQSSSRTKAAKARLMTSCLGSAPYRRGLNTVQLAFCVWSHFSVPRIDMQYLLGFGMHAHTHPHTHTSPWSMGWSVEPGVSLKTRSDNRDSCKGWKPILFQSPLHPSPLPPTATTHTHTHTVPQPQPPAKQAIVSGEGLWYFICHEMDTDTGWPWGSFSKKETATATAAAMAAEHRLQTHLILNLLVQFAPSTLLWTINKPAFSKVER